MWIILAVVGVVIGVPFVLGIVAAIAIPGMMRARMSANEASAIGILRTTAATERLGPSQVSAGEVRDGYEFRVERTSGGFARWAVPSEQGISGTRRFCVDARGVVFEYHPGDAWTDPAPPEARCPPSGVPIDRPDR